LFFGTVQKGRLGLFQASTFNIYMAIEAKYLKAQPFEKSVPNK
jgi:hypothetical protein